MPAGIAKSIAYLFAGRKLLPASTVFTSVSRLSAIVITNPRTGCDDLKSHYGVSLTVFSKYLTALSIEPGMKRGIQEVFERVKLILFLLEINSKW